MRRIALLGAVAVVVVATCVWAARPPVAAQKGQQIVWRPSSLEPANDAGLRFNGV